MKVIQSCALCALLIISSLATASAADIKVIDPWVRPAPPTAPVIGVFMTLQNHGNESISLIEVKSSLQARKVELHRTTMDNGVMKMKKQDHIPVAAHAETRLQPGSWHIMIMGPETVPEKGQSVGLTLVFNDGTELSVEAPVKNPGSAEQGDGHSMNHGNEHSMQHGDDSAMQHNGDHSSK